jgi:predicted RNA-binding protein
MKPRKTKDLQKILSKKGFVENPQIEHHKYFILFVNGKKSSIKTYFSHGKKEYGKILMSQIKKQLKFSDSQSAEAFLTVP